MQGDVESFSLEYPCHSPEQQRWISMEVYSFLLYRDLFYVIKHKDITPQRVAENRVVELARLDDLTQIGNRRGFSDFLQLEWLRCARAGVPLSLMIIDVDFFKLINDNYGHHVGDRCLVRVGDLMQSFCNRPSDFCARYGGDEFALVWGDTGYLDAQLMAEKLLKELRSLALPNENSPVDSIVTVSIGVATVVPGHNSDKDELTIHADDMLYQAKRNGRNRVESIEVQRA
jgi:diguanylate cyclase (GGDEF)-like protein